MQERFKKVVRWAYLVGAGTGVFQLAGCSVDPDIILRAGLSAGSDLAIFLLENLANSL
ncbi:MAG: hypothetical protein JSU63_11645 [Phycisphaerales bacterium]|nr:MAG: hypothetical protein JSU63_11645 [Phycisphaerales bacterium]